MRDWFSEVVGSEHTQIASHRADPLLAWPSSRSSAPLSLDSRYATHVIQHTLSPDSETLHSPAIHSVPNNLRMTSDLQHARMDPGRILPFLASPSWSRRIKATMETTLIVQGADNSQDIPLSDPGENTTADSQASTDVFHLSKGILRSENASML